MQFLKFSCVVIFLARIRSACCWRVARIAGGSSRHGPLRFYVGPVPCSVACATNRILCRHFRDCEESCKELELRVTTLNRRTRRPQVQPDTLALKSLDFFVITCRGAAPPAGTGPSSSPRPRVHGFLGWRQAVPNLQLGYWCFRERMQSIKFSCVLIFLARIPIECCYSKCTLRKPTGFVGRAGTSRGRGVLVHTASSCAHGHHHSKKVHELHLAVTGVQCCTLLVQETVGKLGTYCACSLLVVR